MLAGVSLGRPVRPEPEDEVIGREVGRERHPDVSGYLAKRPRHDDVHRVPWPIRRRRGQRRGLGTRREHGSHRA
jgi:hypothetical protein